jgi:hypothetical protein
VKLREHRGIPFGRDADADALLVHE